ncbi:MAG: segregation/condensation protein A [Hydrogenophilales bacterium CG03_land_8_20_14_0_80_62_28]|nr:segregation/condensation protein A [Betaproteobacteria bacterium]OIO78333.1 MAG: segregation/condensation protein A [Hydrogenophilaceae bacterium CG1_02_62_390]PIV23829.1 MAG: segregation/condensation protein A [Hydrogenophilales bacterium CG03_land_8_20_14_0_80_62_28]PIW38117.1 MAG: segregation/condensation protein A [Hydrogenophilales bacterium CG15_BIG_FIL_POST_REV_8_21_14_020_62_31]PIW72326.1 MAG: segregation/condensation protein A [Hydrogenophilales bacterium CG12_big_fil_rev_8_21_14_0_
MNIAVQRELDTAPALARVLGQDWTELPQDLYIPPDALEVILDAFEGPLDLLLWLIRRNNLNVLDIPMADLTRQYIVYIEAMQVHRLELAAEYLVMAAMLIEIKSRMLLPRPQKAEEGDEHDPRAELVRRLLEYEQMKRAAQNLDGISLLGRDFQIVNVYLDRLAAKRLPQVGIDDLIAAWTDILSRARMNSHHKVGRQDLSVREHMSRILKILQGKGCALFTELFPAAAGRPELVVTFLALLELTRERLIDLTQTEPFAPIHASLAASHADHR